jgi:tight adherence protein B
MLPLLTATATFVGTLVTILLVASVDESRKAGRRDQLTRRVGLPSAGGDRAWLARRIERPDEAFGDIGQRVQLELLRAGMPARTGQILLLIGALAASGVVFFWAAGLGVLSLAGVLFGLLPIITLRLVATAREDAVAAQVPDALDVMVSVLRGGGTVEQAIVAVPADLGAPLGKEFAHVAERVALGVPPGTALGVLAERNPGVGVLHRLGGFVALNQRAGGNLIRLLEQTRDGHRALLAVRERMRAGASEARTTSVILLLLPPLSMIAVAVVMPGYLDPMLEPGVGRTALIATSAWMFGGLFVMHRITRLGAS